MDFKSPRTISVTRTTPNSSFANGKSQNSRDPPSTPKQNSIDAIKLSLMQARRTPIRSLNTARIPNRDFTKPEKLPVKRCFSQEVLELSRHHITITKNSKVDIALLPPKRIKLGDFTYVSKSLHTTTRNHARHCNCTDLSKRKAEQTRVKPPPTHKFPPLENIPNKHNARHGRDGVRIQSTRSMIVPKYWEKDESKMSNFLVSVENFPRDEWRENNFNLEMLREIIFLSEECNMMPVNLMQRNGQIIVEPIRPNDTRTSPSKKNGNMLFDILKSPFNILSGVIRWIGGKKSK